MINVVQNKASSMYEKLPTKENIESVFGKWTWTQIGKGALIGGLGITAIALRPWELVQLAKDFYNDVEVVRVFAKDVATGTVRAGQSLHDLAKVTAATAGAGVAAARAAVNLVAPTPADIPDTFEGLAGLGLSAGTQTSLAAGLYMGIHFSKVLTSTMIDAAGRGLSAGLDAVRGVGIDPAAAAARGLIGKALDGARAVARPVDTRRIGLFEGHSPILAVGLTALTMYNILRG